MNEQEIGFQEILAMARRNLVAALTCLCLGVGISAVVLLYLPPKYKSIAKLAIQPSYFQNPLVGDLMPQITEPGEQNAQRLSLLRYSLNDRFLDTLGEKYKLYKYPAGHPKRAAEREVFLRNIEYFAANSTTYQISVMHGQAQAALDMTRAVLQQMMDTLINERQSALIRIKDALEENVKTFQIALKGAGGPGSSLDYGSLRQELEKINDDIRALTAQYTSQHPDVLKLQERAQAIRNVLQNIPASQRREETMRAIVGPNAKGATQEIYNDLVKKLSMVNIAVDMEKDRDKVAYLAIIEHPALPLTPFFPPRPKILLLGFGAGLFLAGMFSVYRELRRGTFLSAVHAAEMLGVTLLGELPRLAGPKHVRLIEGPGANAIRQYLPAPTKED